MGKHAQFAFYELHRVREETLEGLVLSVLVVLSEAVLVLREAVLVLREAVLVLREAVLVLEPTAITIATMIDRS